MIHGGPALQFVSPLMFDAVDKVVVSVQDVYDAELQSSLLALPNAGTLEDALRLLNKGNIIDLPGNLQPVRSLDDILKIAGSTSHWIVLGRAHLDMERFQEGLECWQP